MPEFVLDLRRLEVYEAGAAVITVLVYPDKAETDDTRGRLLKTLCNRALHARCEVDREWAAMPQLIKPIYAFRRDQDINRDLRTFKRRLRDRMIAGRMAIAFLQEAEAEKTPVLPEGMLRLSINEVARLVLGDAQQFDPVNVENRIWRPSLPVIHLAAAVQVLLQEREREGRQPFYYTHIMLHPAVLERVIQTAQEYERLVDGSARFKSAVSNLIRLRLIR